MEKNFQKSFIELKKPPISYDFSMLKRKKNQQKSTIFSKREVSSFSPGSFIVFGSANGLSSATKLTFVSSFSHHICKDILEASAFR